MTSLGVWGGGQVLTRICFKWLLSLMYLEALANQDNTQMYISKVSSFHIGQMKICHRRIISFDDCLGGWAVTGMEMRFFGTRGVKGSFLSLHTQAFSPSSFPVWLLGLTSGWNKFPLERLYFFHPESTADSRTCFSNRCDKRQRPFLFLLWTLRKLVSPQGYTWGISSWPALHSLQP